MARINLATQTAPSAPSAGTAEIFVHSVDKKMYILDDAGILETIENGIAAIIAAQTVTAAATTTVVGGTNSPVPANTIQAGTTFRITILGSFTGTATATAFRVHLGTAGTSADPIIFTASVTGAVGTSLAKVVIEFTFRTVGATGTLNGYLQIWQHAAAVVGVANTGTSVVIGTTTTAPNTTVNNYITISILSAAAGSSGTIQNAIIEMVK